MSPLFTYNGKLLVVDGKLAANENCCCGCDCDACNIESETVYYGALNGNFLSLNGDAYPVCNFTFEPPEIITGTIQLLKPDLCRVKLRFWRNIFSNCNGDQPADITEEKVTINCTDGRILVENLGTNTRKTLNNGDNVIYDSIGLDPEQGPVPESSAGDTIVICLRGTESATFTVEAKLNWTTQRDHDLYGNISC
jgi:hypothetical protein